MNNKSRIMFSVVLCLAIAPAVYALDFPGPEPGPAQAKIQNERLVLSNAVISCAWGVSDDRLKPVSVINHLNGRTLQLGETEVFRLMLEDDRVIAASDLKIVGEPAVEKLEPVRDAATLARRHAGYRLTVRLVAKDENLEVEWRAILRDGSNAVRQEYIFSVKRTAVPLKEIQLLEIPAPDAEIVGTVSGSPAVAGNIFFCYERPHSQNSVIGSQAGNRLVLSHPVVAVEQDRPLQPKRSVQQSAAIGVVPEGQIRRGFLYYVENERAHPYRPFLHYNSWYDICWSNIKISEQDCLPVIELFGRELIEKRGVPLASFVWDDGWDDPKTLWRMLKESFPNGFSKMLAEVRRYNSALGVWMSPFGGYGQAQKDRLAYGKEQGFEIGEQGVLLSKEKYFARFRETCLEMIEENGVNFFKFDGLARGFAETEAMIRLCQDLRANKPDIFLSITTGTWPSPFWLWPGDSTWRGGSDMGWHGEGSKREQWITYRDMDTYHGVVLKAPLYPINSLMTQGFAHAKHGYASELGNSDKEIRSELRSFFASGTCLQELYVTPSMMSPQNWDDLAETAKWSDQNADILVDTHWIGGDPKEGETYGWASWSKRKGILALRNPKSKPDSIRMTLAEMLELPAKAPARYAMKSPWKSDAVQPAINIQADTPFKFTLDPFEVLVYEAVPLD
ncbi:MAG: enterotoxin [bacterium]